jgi:hypothetical protein
MREGAKSQKIGIAAQEPADRSFNSFANKRRGRPRREARPRLDHISAQEAPK